MPLREVCPAFRKIPIAAQTIRKSPQTHNTEQKKKKKKKKKTSRKFVLVSLNTSIEYVSQMYIVFPDMM